jgi:hypothetical protein
MILTVKKKIDLEEKGKQIIEKARDAGINIGGASLGFTCRRCLGC